MFFDLIKEIKYSIQRITRKSRLSDKDLWDFYVSISKRLSVALEDFYQLDRAGYPADLNNMVEWDLAIRKMINAFNILSRDEFDEITARIDEIREGLDLFSEYFMSMWD